MSTSVLETLIHLSKVDASLARIFADKTKLEQILAAKEAELKKLLLDKDAKTKVAAQKKSNYLVEEKSIKEEQAKLVERRRALDTLGNYKLQQAALREIEYATRQLGARDDGLLKLIEESDAANDVLRKAEVAYEEASAALTNLRKETEENLILLETRRSEKVSERAGILPRVLPANLQIYERTKMKYPGDAMVAVAANSSCGGCFIQVAAQLMVHIHQGDSLVKCRGCGRILYLDPKKVEEAAAAAAK
jgi:predicted  nucleic acid-binding Zn-ribbon protein